MAATEPRRESSGAVEISLKTVHQNRLVAEFAAPLRDLTVRETPSRGPDSASVRMRRRASGPAEQLLAAGSGALLLAERVRATICAVASAGRSGPPRARELRRVTKECRSEAILADDRQSKRAKFG